jgi:hypothetical protein
LLEKYDYDKRKPDMKYRCGFYLKRKFKNKYCIILTQSHYGSIRFNSWCYGEKCDIRIWTDKIFVKRFKYAKNKKYMKEKCICTLYKKYETDLIEYSNSLFADSKYGESYIGNNKKFSYILFFNSVSSLDDIIK